MIQELYQKNLLRLAADAIGDGVMSDPDAEITLDNPVCGDRITVQVKFKDGKITDLRHENRSCMLCQASASVLGAHAAGLAFKDVLEIREAVRSMLNKEDGQKMSPWRDLDCFHVVAEHKSRHQCVLLPFDALIGALETFKTKA